MRPLAFLAVLLFPLAAAAQPEPAVPTPATPPPPIVDDPMLSPMAPAKREVATWNDALALVHARSTDLATALAEIRRAEAQSRIALAGALPTINGTANAPHQLITKEVPVAGAGGGTAGGTTGPTTKVPAGDFIAANITLNQPLVNLGAWYAIGTAHRSEDVSKLAAEDVTRTITLVVAEAIVAVVSAEHVAELNRIGLRSALERREITSRRRNLGVATGLDVVRADQDVAQARATLVTGDESLRKAREALGLALGLPEGVGVPHDLKLDDVVASATRSCPNVHSLDERADIVAQKKRIEVADRNAESVKLAFLPTLSLGSTLATTTADTGVSPATTWNISAILSVPIWDGGVKYGQLRNANALRDEAGYQLDAQTRAATVDIEQARRGIVVAQASLEVARQARDLAAQVDQLTQTAYRAGQGTSLELVVAASALRQAEIELAISEFTLVRARLEALFALAKCST